VNPLAFGQRAACSQRAINNDKIRGKSELRPTENGQKKTKKTTEKKEEQVFIVGRTRTLYYSLQSKGGKERRQHSPQRTHLEEPN
jgi:hypothetical protein